MIFFCLSYTDTPLPPCLFILYLLYPRRREGFGNAQGDKISFYIVLRWSLRPFEREVQSMFIHYVPCALTARCGAIRPNCSTTLSRTGNNFANCRKKSVLIHEFRAQSRWVGRPVYLLKHINNTKRHIWGQRSHNGQLNNWLLFEG